MLSSLPYEKNSYDPTLWQAMRESIHYALITKQIIQQPYVITILALWEKQLIQHCDK